MKKTIELGQRIKEIRSALNLRQAEFAEKLEITASSLSEIETGRNRPGVEFLIKLTETFDVNLYYVLFGIGEMFVTPVMRYFLDASNFSRNLDDVKNFLEIFSKSKQLQYFILSVFEAKMAESGPLIMQEIEKRERERERDRIK